jgi:hypothetical protein
LYQVFSYHHYQNILYLLLNTANPVITPFDVNPKIPGRGMSLSIVILLLRQRRRLGINVETTSVAMYVYTKETTETVQAKPYEALGCL